MESPYEVPFSAVEDHARLELGGTYATVINDPFMKTSLAGATVAWHVNKVLAIEARAATATLDGDGSCDDPRWKPILAMFLCEMGDLPTDPVYIGHAGHVGLALSPLHGALYVGRHPFSADLYLRFGAGGVGLVGDDVWLCAGPPPGPTWRPTTDLGFGGHVFLAGPLALTWDFHRLVYIDVVNQTTLEMKNNLLVAGGISIYVPD